MKEKELKNKFARRIGAVFAGLLIAIGLTTVAPTPAMAACPAASPGYVNLYKDIQYCGTLVLFDVEAVSDSLGGPTSGSACRNFSSSYNNWTSSINNTGVWNVTVYAAQDCATNQPWINLCDDAPDPCARRANLTATTTNCISTPCPTNINDQLSSIRIYWGT